MFVRNLSIHNLNYPFPLKIVTDYINSVKYWLLKRYISRVVQFWFLWKYFNLQLFSDQISYHFHLLFVSFVHLAYLCKENQTFFAHAYKIAFVDKDRTIHLKSFHI